MTCFVGIDCMYIHSVGSLIIQVILKTGKQKMASFGHGRSYSTFVSIAIE